MTSTIETGNPLIEKSQILRQQLCMQRKLIKQQINPASTMNNSYPRSMTMRFITQHPALVAGLVTEAATLLMGARLLKSLAVALSAARIVRSTAVISREK